MSLTTALALNFSAQLQNAAIAGAVASYPLNLQPAVSHSLASGTGSSKADQLFSKLYTVAASATAGGAAIDLTSLGTDSIGNTISMVTVKELLLLIRGNEACTQVASATVHAAGGGSGYTNNDVLTVAGGTGTAAQFTATVAGGAVTAVTLKAASGFTGGSYTANPTLSNNAATGGTGTGVGLDLTMATVAAGSGVFTEADYLSIGGDNTVNTWVSFLADKTDIIKLYSGNSANPGFLAFGGGGNTGYAIGASNKLLKIVNSGSNPLSFYLYLVGASA